MHARFSGAVAALLLALSNCANHEATPAGSPQNSTDGYLSMRYGSSHSQLRKKGDELVGPDIQVSRTSDGGYRGFVNRSSVDLRLHDSVLEGSIANATTRLSFHEEGDVLRIEGLYAGKVGHLDISPRDIKGMLGGCHYSLDRGRDPGLYGGTRTVDSSAQTAYVILPPWFAQVPADEAATIVALFMGC
jgi:hypothetical protein